MKAREVDNLDPDAPLVDNMRRVILVRLDEVYGFGDAALDPANVQESHDMRIAAKRLRYLLELSRPLFGGEIAEAAKVVKGLQDVLGDIHDFDELGDVARARGLEAIAEEAAARRAALHESFTAEWQELQDNEFRGSLEAALNGP